MTDTPRDQAEILDAEMAAHQAEPHPWLPPSQLRLHASLHAVVESQLVDPATPFVAATLERLQDDGMSRHQAIHAIADVASVELTRALQGGYDAARYRKALAALDVDAVRRDLVERGMEALKAPRLASAADEPEQEDVVIKVDGDGPVSAS